MLSIGWILYLQCISVVHDISEYMLFWINTTPLFVLPHLFIKNLCALLSSHLASIPSLQIKQMSSRNQLSSEFWQDISTWWYAQNYLELCYGSNTHVHVQWPEITDKFHFVSLMTDVGPWFFTISFFMQKVHVHVQQVCTQDSHVSTITMEISNWVIGFATKHLQAGTCRISGAVWTKDPKLTSPPHEIDPNNDLTNWFMVFCQSSDHNDH